MQLKTSFYAKEWIYFLTQFIPMKSLRRRIKGRIRYKIDHPKVANYLNVHYVQPYLKGKLKQWEFVPKVRFEDSKIIWQFWHQGVENAPEFVKKCFNSVQQHMGDGYKIILLDKENLKDYLDLPSFVLKKIEDKSFACKPITAFSDVLRLCLLATYGGIWMDASLFLSDRIPQVIVEREFFAFCRSSVPPKEYKQWITFDCNYFNWEQDFMVKLCNSFMLSSVKQPLICALCDCLLAYWEQESHIRHYFIFQMLFELLEQNFSVLRDFGDTDLHLLQYWAKQPYSSALWAEICAKTAIHKCTYPKALNKDTMLYQIVMQR